MYIMCNVCNICIMCIFCAIYVICANCAWLKRVVSKFRIILILKKHACMYLWKNLDFSQINFCGSLKKRSNDPTSVNVYYHTLKETPLFTKWKRLHFNHHGRGWFSHNFSHDFPVITLFWYPYIIPVNRIFMPKIK